MDGGSAAPAPPYGMSGLLIAFEGLDQSGKQTQAEMLAARLTRDGRSVRLLSFPDYETPIGAEIGRALHGERDYSPDVMQLLYVANRYEYKKEILREEKPTIDFAYACIVTIKPVRKGETLSKENLWVKRPGTGPLLAKDFPSVLGKKALHDLAKDIQLTPSDFE